MGHAIDGNGIRPYPDKVQALVNFKTHDVKSLIGFLGLARISDASTRILRLFPARFMAQEKCALDLVGEAADGQTEISAVFDIRTPPDSL